MGAVTPETCRVTLQWNKSDCILLHLVRLSFNINYDAWNHELKILNDLGTHVSSWQISRVSTFSFSCLYVVNRRPRKASLSGPHRGHSEGQGQDYTADSPDPQSSVSKWFRQCGQQCEDGHCKTQGILTAFLGLCIQLQALACHTASDSIMPWPLVNSSLDNVPTIAIVTPRNCKYNFPAVVCCMNILFTVKGGVSMQYTGIYFPVRNVEYIFHTRDDSAKQEVTFFTTEIKKTFANVRTFLFVWFCE